MTNKNGIKKWLFNPGQIVTTPGALDAGAKNEELLLDSFERHVRGDWGSLSEEDTAQNDDSIKNGGGFHSAYTLKDGTKIWIITEQDRSATTVLLPSEY